MAGGEGGGKDTIGRGVGQGGAPSPTDSLRWIAKAPLTGVGFCPAHKPTYQGGVTPGGGGFGEILPPTTS